MSDILELILELIKNLLDLDYESFMITLLGLITLIMQIFCAWFDSICIFIDITYTMLIISASSYYLILLERLNEIKNIDFLGIYIESIEPIRYIYIIIGMLIYFYFVFFYKPESDENINIDETPNNFISEADLNFLLELVLEFFYIGKWILLPICLYFSFIYILHAILGLYSVYVDYFQKIQIILMQLELFYQQCLFFI